jgi:membrane-associated protein
MTLRPSLASSAGGGWAECLVSFAVRQCHPTTFAAVTTALVALPAVMDPMYWLGHGGVFGSAVLPGVMLIVFVETGLLIPFLPGDTLLFAAGLLAAQDDAPVGIWTLAPCAAIAAVVGGQLGYFIGWRLGPALFKKDDARFFKKHYLTSSHDFFARHGRKTIVIGHFVGVVRTFMPVIAGASGMRYSVFLVCDVIGAAAWGVGLTVVAFHLGNVPFVGAHLDWMVLLIAVLSMLPVTASVLRAALSRRRASGATLPD